MKHLAQRIKLYRQSMKISQEELGKRLGLSKGTIYNWENGIAKPNDYYIQCLARLFEVGIEELTGEEKKEYVTIERDKILDTPFLKANALANDLIGLFAGGQLTDNDVEALMLTLQSAYISCKTKTLKFPTDGDDTD